MCCRYDKLKSFGFSIHGCVDGFSRKVLWYYVATTNNNPYVICYYYLITVKKFKLIPVLMRSDKGGENTIIDNVHQAFRSFHDDKLSGLKSIIKGKSTANQRIESAWGRMRRHSVQFWINFFKDMRDANEFNKHDKMQVECLRFCFGPLIQYDLDLTRREWNRHNIRKQKTGDIVPGKPNFLYYVPHENGATQCGKSVHTDHIDNAMRNFRKVPTYCSPVFMKLVEELFPNIEQPSNAKDAKILCHKILNEINRYTA